MEGGLDFIRLAPREQVYVYFSFSKGATRWRIRPGYFDPNRMIREGGGRGGGGGAKDDSARNERSGRIERDVPARSPVQFLASIKK